MEVFSLFFVQLMSGLVIFVGPWFYLSNNRSIFGFALFFFNIFYYLVYLVIFWFILIILFLTLELNTELSCLFELLFSNGESISFF